jgi:hypothetical protein
MSFSGTAAVPTITKLCITVYGVEQTSPLLLPHAMTPPAKRQLLLRHGWPLHVIRFSYNILLSYLSDTDVLTTHVNPKDIYLISNGIFEGSRGPANLRW